MNPEYARQTSSPTTFTVPIMVSFHRFSSHVTWNWKHRMWRVTEKRNAKKKTTYVSNNGGFSPLIHEGVTLDCLVVGGRPGAGIVRRSVTLTPAGWFFFIGNEFSKPLGVVRRLGVRLAFRDVTSGTKECVGVVSTFNYFFVSLFCFG